MKWFAVLVAMLLVGLGSFFWGAAWATRNIVPGARHMMDASMRLSMVRTGLEMFYSDTGRYPTPTEGLQILTQPFARGPYIESREITDPWGRPVVYVMAADGRPTLSILGADGVPGGINENADLLARPISDAAMRMRATWIGVMRARAR